MGLSSRTSLITGVVVMASLAICAACAMPARGTELSFSASPTSLPPPGGSVTYRLDIAKSPPPVITEHINRVTDSVVGEIYPANRGFCSFPGSIMLSCIYTVPFTGVAGDVRTDTVTVTSSGDKSSPSPDFPFGPYTAVRQAVATVTLTPAAAAPAARKKCKRKQQNRKRCHKKRHIRH